MASTPMHVDPEFDTFTYGDPTSPKRSLAKLKPGDLLVFYAGMEGWGHICPPALYLAGYFRVKLAGFAPVFPTAVINREFAANFHVRHTALFAQQYAELVLIKGDSDSRLFQRAHLIGQATTGPGRPPWQFITPAMAEVFGYFGGKGSLQRSNPRWVEDSLCAKAEAYVEALS